MLHVQHGTLIKSASFEGLGVLTKTMDLWHPSNLYTLKLVCMWYITLRQKLLKCNRLIVFILNSMVTQVPWSKKRRSKFGFLWNTVCSWVNVRTLSIWLYAYVICWIICCWYSGPCDTATNISGPLTINTNLCPPATKDLHKNKHINKTARKKIIHSTSVSK